MNDTFYTLNTLKERIKRLGKLKSLKTSYDMKVECYEYNDVVLRTTDKANGDMICELKVIGLFEAEFGYLDKANTAYNRITKGQVSNLLHALSYEI